jgi:hypothetical protein
LLEISMLTGWLVLVTWQGEALEALIMNKERGALKVRLHTLLQEIKPMAAILTLSVRALSMHGALSHRKFDGCLTPCR